MTFAYDVGHQRLTVTVNEASDIPDPDRVNLSHSQIHLLLLPNTKKIRHRTKAKTGENPKFEDTFRIKISTGISCGINSHQGRQSCGIEGRYSPDFGQGGRGDRGGSWTGREILL